MPRKKIAFQPASTSSDATSRNNYEVAALPTIDLHGYRVSEGIKTLTAFMDQVVSNHRKKKQHHQQNRGTAGDVWVLVITGSGIHSPEGPVLRSAVQALLEKRKMTYVVNRGKGSFNIKADSGIVLYEPGNPIDTKVVLARAQERITLPKPRRTAHDEHTNGLVYEEDAPTPSEVHATDSAIHQSRVDFEKAISEKKKDENLLQRAVSMSILHAEKEEKEEEELMKRAMSMSMLDQQNTDIDDDLQRALELSQKDFQHVPDDDEELKKALAMSQSIVSQEDEELLQVLELSKVECKASYSPSFAMNHGNDLDNESS